MAKSFNNTMRYIDDLLTLNNTRFECTIEDIYPPELQLKKTTDSQTTLSYLDILTMGSTPRLFMTKWIVLISLSLI